ncbi:hypothetical protein ACJJIW_05435 [Microbulbifer sp. JMSA004]|uniref:hypothetical protein n=1 Tax=unclassified Microbulbifer TaxID=2619833 RepID=UPI0024ACAA5C|nr:hypothetical protein [Microbulbifer sp. VAAF005]WHI44675.1 hypothetical protein P0078_13055 [Microbulbifer sp. VAAF005]
MIDSEDKKLTNEERAEIAKRKLEMEIQKKANQVTSLSELKNELREPNKGNW